MNHLLFPELSLFVPLQDGPRPSPPVLPAAASDDPTVTGKEIPDVSEDELYNTAASSRWG